LPAPQKVRRERSSVRGQVAGSVGERWGSAGSR
jgi:hypothetical protein